MRYVTKEELLSLEGPVLFREWSPRAYNDYGWTLTCGKDFTGNAFGAIEIDPDPTEKEEVRETWDWDGPLDLDDDKTYVIAEKEDIELIKARLQIALNECNFDEIFKVGKDPTEA